MRWTTLLSLLFLLAPIAELTAADWPQWRGPNRDGKSADKNLLEEWPSAGPKLLWSIEDPKKIGAGYGTPAIVGEQLFIIGSDSNKQTATEFCTCLNAKDGEQVWQTKLNTSTGRFLDRWGGGPRSTPTVVGDYLYVLGATGDLVCLTKKDGKIVWQKNLVEDFGGKIPTWGYSESPLVDGEAVVVTPGNDTGMVALNIKDGAVIWKCKDFDDGAGYSSIMITEVGGVKQYVQQTMKSGLGVRAKDGKLLWKVGEIGRRTAVIPTPVIQDGYVFFTAGYNAGCECYKLEKDGDGTKASLVYTKNNLMVNHHGGVIVVGDYVYGHSDSNKDWICMEFKKDEISPVWKNKGVGKGSISQADGFFYCYSERSGELARIKVTEKGYEEAGKFRIPGTSSLRKGTSGAVWAHPVIANGKLYLRDYELLYVYDLSKPGS